MPNFKSGMPMKAKINVIDKKSPTINKTNPTSIPIKSQNNNKIIRFNNAMTLS